MSSQLKRLWAKRSDAHMTRIAKRFSELRDANRAAFIPFVTAGDPDAKTSFEIVRRLPAAGADLIELGIPFSDPMADGPAIQASSQRALRAGMTLRRLLEMVRVFRKEDTTTPLILMGYYNSIHAFGVARFVEEATRVGIDGLITVDLPPEEDAILRDPASARGIDVIRLATPTTDDARLPAVLDGAGGFLYYVSVAGVTGTKTFSGESVNAALARVRRHSHIPVAVGFGIRTADQAAEIARFADGAVVGSAIVSRIAELGSLRGPPLADEIIRFCVTLAGAVHGARSQAMIE